MKVKRLDHVNIRTPVFEESLRFYTEALGLRPGPMPGILQSPAGEAARGAWLYDASGCPIVHLIRAAPDTTLTATPASFDHLGLACEEPERYAEHLARLGIPVQRVAFPQYGILQLVVHDPNGIKIELAFGEPVSAIGANG